MSIEAKFHLRRSERFTLDVDVTVPHSGVTAIFGPSGSGKTTLLRALAGLEHCPGGYLRVNGETWQGNGRALPPHRRPLGFVFQDTCLFEHLSVRGNLAYGCKRAGRPADGAEFDRVTELLGVRPLLARRPAGLSGGEARRVAIARALLPGPRLLLMDEPLSGLDLESRREILPFLERLHRRLEIPVFYVSHQPREVMRLADHLVLMARGRIEACAPLDELRGYLERIDGEFI